MLVKFKFAMGSYRKGKEYNISEARADFYIKHKIAEEVKTAQKAAPVKAKSEPVKKAEAPAVQQPAEPGSEAASTDAGNPIGAMTSDQATADPVATQTPPAKDEVKPKQTPKVKPAKATAKPKSEGKSAKKAKG